MKKKINVSKNSIVLFWIFSAFIFMAVTIAFYYVSYSFYQKDLRNEIIRSNKLILRDMQTVTNRLFEDSDKMFSEFSFNQRIQTLIKSGGSTGVDEMYMIYSLADELKSYISTQGIAFSAFIYLPSNNYVVTEYSCADSYSYYNAIYSKTGKTYDQWVESMYTSNNKWIADTNVDSMGNKQDVIRRSRVIPFNTPNGALMVMEIDKGDLFGSLELSEDEAVLIFNKRNELVTYWGQEYSEAVLDVISDSAEYDLLSHKIDTQNLVISYLSPGQSGYGFAYVAREREYWLQLNTMRTILQMIIIAYVLLGGFLMYYIFKRSYKPIQDIIHMWEGGKKFSIRENEFAIIQTHIKGFIEKEKTFELDKYRRGKLNQQEKMVKLLLGNEKVSAESLRSSEIRFSTEKFCVLLFEVEDSKRVFHDTDDPKMALKGTENIAEEMLGELCNVYYTNIGDRIVMLINPKSERMSSPREMDETLSRTAAILKHYYGFAITVAVSSMVLGVDNIPNAYRQAENTVDYKILMGKDSVIYADELQIGENALYTYDFEKEQALFNSIVDGQHERSASVFKAVIEENFGGEYIAVRQARHLLSDMMGTVTKAIFEIDKKYHKFSEASEKYSSRLSGCETFADLKSIINLVCKDVGKYICLQAEDDIFSAVKKVEDYIKRNYSDKEMNVAMVTNQFDLPDISKIFRDNTGKKILDYINEERIEQAKRLLLSSEDMTIDCISDAVGFNSTRSFIRVFKHIAGTTPTKYRAV